jgi:hypothetical protein
MEVLNANIPLSHHKKSSPGLGEEGHQRAEVKNSALKMREKKYITHRDDMHCCPVCKKRINPNKAYVKVQYKQVVYYPCCPLC